MEAWRQRTPRERGFILLAAGLSLAVVVWVGAVEPWQRRLAALEVTVARQREDLAWMTRAVARFSTAPARGDAAATTPLLTAVDRSAAAAGLGDVVVQLELTREGALVRLENAAFGPLMAWLVTLDRERGISVVNGRLARRSPGRVDAQLLLTRGT
ncbi:MAG: type II secretion system protein GspM [Candidatus Competibacterales bacterium]